MLNVTTIELTNNIVLKLIQIPQLINQYSIQTKN